MAGPPLSAVNRLDGQTGRLRLDACNAQPKVSLDFHTLDLYAITGVQIGESHLALREIVRAHGKAGNLRTRSW
jgi:hypothetical protein